MLWVGPQIVIGLLEGSAGQGEDYTVALSENLGLYLPILFGAAAFGLLVHLWLWRALWQPRIP